MDTKQAPDGAAVARRTPDTCGASGVRAASGIPRDLSAYVHAQAGAAFSRPNRRNPTEMNHEGQEDHEEIVFVCFCAFCGYTAFFSYG
jgi:hypothetical protein